MTNQLWSWVLAVVGILGIYLAGRQKAVGWLIGMLAQALWLTYAITTRQWGFLLSCFLYGAAYTRNYMLWRSGAKKVSNDPS